MHRKWWTLLAIACGTFMAMLDASVVNIALPTLSKEFSANLVQIKWIIIVYNLVITCLLLPFGSLSDQWGRKLTYISGFSIFTIGSLLCALSTSLEMLVLSRGIQGVGAAFLMTNGPAVVTATFGPKERGKALGILAMAVSLGLMSGPTLGGLLIEFLGWKTLFSINVPIGVVGIYLAFQFITKDKAQSSKLFDWPGSIVQVLLLLIVLILLDPPNISISGSLPYPIPRIALFILLLALSAVFYQIETNSKNPIFDFTLLKEKLFLLSNLALFFIFIAYASVFVLMPFFLEDFLGYSTSHTGLFMTMIPIGIFVFAPLSGRLSDHWGSRGLTLAGTLIATVGLFYISGIFGKGIENDFSALQICTVLLVTGLALGLFQSPNNNVIMSSVPEDKLSSASAMVATFRNMAMVIGTSLSISLFNWKLPEENGYIHGLHNAHLVAAFVALLAVVSTWATKSGPLWKKKGPQ